MLLLIEEGTLLFQSRQAGADALQFAVDAFAFAAEAV
jgi:hypothetical protein